MKPDPATDANTSTYESMRAAFVLLAAVLLAVFSTELAIMFALPYLLPPGAGQVTEALLDSSLLSVVLATMALPLIAAYRRRILKKALSRMALAQADQFRGILDNLGEGVYTLDVSGKLTYLNAQAEHLLGWQLPELLGRSLHDVIHHHGADGQPLAQDQCPIHLAMAGGQVYRSSEEIFFHKDGIPIPVTITVSPLKLEGGVVGSVAVFSDLRDEQLLQKRLLEAKNLAESAARTKSEFLSTMSHEIRTPLNGVIGMTELLLGTRLSTEQAEFAGTIKVSADALMDVINNILDFSKIEAGQMKIEKIAFGLRPMMEGALDFLAVKAHEKNLLLASFIAPELPDHLIGDPTRIRQILLNFLANALKFTEKGEVVLSATAVAGAATRRNAMLIEFAVRDTGIGLSNKATEHLFLPFAQADSSTTRKYGGTGLGLSISSRLADAMGGDLGVRSVLGEGSTFWMRVALETASDDTVEGESVKPLQGTRVLVAGGTAGFQGVVGRYFQAWNIGHEAVSGLQDLRQRLVAQKASGLGTDLVLLGQSLPDAGLAEAVAVLQQDGHRAIVCCLPHQCDRELKFALMAQGVTVMQQPVKQSALFDCLMTALFSPQSVRPDAKQGGTDTFISKHRVLLAEDNEINQRVAMHVLRRLGYGVDVVENGALAVEAAATGAYALVLMDCQMPVMDGFAAAAAIRLRETISHRHIPIVAMTANALKGDKERCLAAGMDDYVTKPIDAARLAQALANWLPQEPSMSFGLLDSGRT
jgi:PAS domain S-box-containing protein